MSPLFTQILLYLCGTFALGILVGWLTRQLLTTRASQRSRTTWEERLRRQRQELEAAQHAIRTHSAQIQSLHTQLKAANSALEERDIVLAIATKEVEAKIAELAALEPQIRDAREKEAESNSSLSEERHLAQSLEYELQALRRNLADKAEAQLHLSQHLKDQERQSVNMRELEANSKLQQSRFETIIQTKEIAIQQLQSRLATFETQQTRLTESNRKLRHSCARYQADLNEKAAELHQLRDRLDSLKQRDIPLPVSPAIQPTVPDLQMYMDVRQKDVEIARLRARISGLQMLLRRGPARLQSVPSGVPVDVTQNNSLQE